VQITTDIAFTGDSTIYARWTSASSGGGGGRGSGGGGSTLNSGFHTIIFNANGGTVAPASATTENTGRLTNLPTPVRIGYNFIGWFTATTGGTQVTINTAFTGNTTVYARWRVAGALGGDGVTGRLGWTLNLLNRNIPGDVNGDGVVSTTDAVLILRHAAGILTPRDYINFCFIAADVNGDGKVDTADAILILRMVAGLSGECGHDNYHPTFGICMENEFCGHMRNSTPGMFEHYMYRRYDERNGFANHISANHSVSPNITANLGIDIIIQNEDIEGVPIFAQGPGEVIRKGGSDDRSTGFFIVIKYDNGYTARYLHLKFLPTISGRVDETDEIGITGRTGRIVETSETGEIIIRTWAPHLHYDVNTGGYWDGNEIRDNPDSVVPATTVFPSKTFTGIIN
jgi:uncharacterized repeat protein (TIGR02543 family)